MRPFSILVACSVLAIAACAKSDDVTVEENIGVETIQQIMPQNGVVELPGHGKEVWFAYGAISGNDWTPANGVLTGHVFEDNTTVVTLQLNVQPAKEGSFYEAWVTNPETTERTSIGHLTNPFNDARHSVRFEDTTDLRAYTEVSVTLEEDDGNSQPSNQVVARGVLNPTRR